MTDEQPLEENKPDVAPVKQKRVRRMRVLVLLVLAVALLGLGGSQLFARFRATTKPAPPPNPKVEITEDAAVPAESKPKVDDYQVPADEPRSITLVDEQATGLIQKVGITKDNAIAAPNNVNFAGWYTKSVKPGDPGLSVIDGHVSGKYSDGVFKKLGQLTKGQHIEVEYGDKSVKTFEVVETKTLAEKDTVDYLLKHDPQIDNQLNLITCGGTFDRASQHFNNRVVVVSKLITT